MTRASLLHTMNHNDLLGLFRNSHWRCSVKEGVLKNMESLVNNVQACNFIEKILEH